MASLILSAEAVRISIGFRDDFRQRYGNNISGFTRPTDLPGFAELEIGQSARLPPNGYPRPDQQSLSIAIERKLTLNPSFDFY
jgi:hypothetical protein